MNEFSVTVLGSSSATPTSSRFPSAQIVSHNHQPFLVDCGEGTQIQIRKNKIRFSKINHIFISHMHGDHFFGLIGLVSSLNLHGRDNDLHIYAPNEIQEVVEVQLAASQTVLKFKMVYHFLGFDNKSLIFENDKLEIFSFPLKHSIPTCGFLFKEKVHPRKIKKEMLSIYDIPDSAFEGIKLGLDFQLETGELIKNKELTKPGFRQKSYAYCSDTIYSDEIKTFVENVDLLYHECSFMEDMRSTAIAKMHSTTLDAATVAKETDAKKLMIGHYSARYKELDPVLTEAQSFFPNTILAIDDLKVEL